MLNFTAMIQGIDTIFTNFIFIPALLILYLKFRPEKALEQTHQKSVSAMYSSDFCLCHPDFLCRVHLYTSKLLHVLQTAVSFRLSRHCSILRFSAILCHLVRIWE